LYGNSSKETEIHIEYLRDLYQKLYDLQMNSSLFFTGHLNSFLEKLHRNQTSTTGYTILSEPVGLQYPEDVWFHLKNPFIFTAFYDNLLQIERCSDKTFFAPQSSMCRTLISLMRPSNRYYPAEHAYKRSWNSSKYPTGAVEEELVKCQKSVYVERSDQLELKYMSENYKKKRFYYLQERFDSTQKKWSFYNLQKSKLPFYFSMFLQSGIFHELHRMKLLRDHYNRQSMTSEINKRTYKPEILDLTSSVQTVFILFAAMALLAKVVFVAEFCYSNCNILFLKRELVKVTLGAKFAYHTLKSVENFQGKLFKLNFLRGWSVSLKFSRRFGKSNCRGDDVMKSTKSACEKNSRNTMRDDTHEKLCATSKSIE